MVGRPTESTRTDRLFPYTAMVRSGCTGDTRGTSVAGKAGSIASGPWCPAGTVPMRPAPWRIDAGAVRSARGLRRLQRAVTLQRLFQVAAQRRAVLGLLFEDGLLAQQVAVLALDRSEEHTSELPSLLRNSSAVFC